MNDVLLSKIVANATEVSWAQAYSTLNFYVVLSLEREGQNLAQMGKETLERLQREYFALDQKTLPQIKVAVKNVIEDFDQNTTYSVVLATLVDGVLYIVIAGNGSVILKRDGKIGTVAKGEIGEITGFSGRLNSNDILIIETHGFSQKLSTDALLPLINSLNVVEISENIAPVIHAEPKGNEAAIIILYTSNETETIAPSTQETEEVTTEEPKPQRHLPKISLPQINLSNLPFSKLLYKKNAIVLGVVILILILLVSIFLDKNSKESAKREKVLSAAVTQANQNLTDGNALLSLNKPLALDKFKQAQKILNEAKSELKDKSQEEKKVDSLLQNVNNQIKKLESGNLISSLKTVFDPQNTDLKGTKFLALEASTAFAASSDKAAFLDNASKISGDVQNSDADSPLAVALSENEGYVLNSQGVSQVKKGQSGKSIIDSKNAVAIGIFGDNVYLLNKQDKNIEKYTPPSYAKSSYIKSGSELASVPVAFAIDGSIWVLDEDGKIIKFTRGVKDDFNPKGVSGQFDKNSLIFTNSDSTSLYILDRTNSRLVVIGKNGDFKNQYSARDIKNSTSFAVDEKNKRALFVIDGKILSFDL